MYSIYTLTRASVVAAMLMICHPSETMGKANCSMSLPNWDAMMDVRLGKAPARTVNEQSVQVTREMATLFDGSTLQLALCIGEQLPTEYAYGFLPNELSSCLRSGLKSDIARSKFDSCIPKVKTGEDARWLLDHEIAMLGLHILGEYQEIFDPNVDQVNFHVSRGYHVSMMRSIEAAWDEILLMEQEMQNEAQDLVDWRARNSEIMDELRTESRQAQISGDTVDSLSQIVEVAIRSVESEESGDKGSTFSEDHRFFGPDLDFLVLANLIQEHRGKSDDLYPQLIEAHKLVGELSPALKLEADIDTVLGRLMAYAEKLQSGDSKKYRPLEDIFSDLNRLDNQNFRLWEQLQPMKYRNEQFSEMVVWLQRYVRFVRLQFAD